MKVREECTTKLSLKQRTGKEEWRIFNTVNLSGADGQELATPVPSLYVTAFLQTDLFLVHLFFCERAVPVQ